MTWICRWARTVFQIVFQYSHLYFLHIMQAIRHNDPMSYAITATILQLILKWKFHNNVVTVPFPTCLMWWEKLSHLCVVKWIYSLSFLIPKSDSDSSEKYNNNLKSPFSILSDTEIPPEYVLFFYRSQLFMCLSAVFIHCHQQKLLLEKSSIVSKHRKILATTKNSLKKKSIHEGEHWKSFVPYCELFGCQS